MNRLFVLGLLAAAMVAACGGEKENAPGAASSPVTSATPTPASTSGIQGRVLLGPTCPVQREGMPCEEPYEATIVVWDAARTHRVLTFDSDDEGRFRAPLPPGDYYIEPQGDEQGSPRPQPETVAVPMDTFVSVTLRYDTGIR